MSHWAPRLFSIDLNEIRFGRVVNLTGPRWVWTRADALYHNGSTVFNAPLKEPLMPATAPYGTWRSPLTADLAAAAGRRIADLVCDGPDLYWGESRPAQSGRVTIMRRRANGDIDEVLPDPFNCRSRVHEYGGGAFSVHQGTVYFSHMDDQRLYRLVPGQAPAPLTAEGHYRYADGRVDERRNRLICVREDHSAQSEPRNEIVGICLDTGEVTVLAGGQDFYANPRLDPAGHHACWLQWDHPNMPWDGTSLCVAAVTEDGTFGPPDIVAGGLEESVYCPQWSPSGVLHFVSDRSGWWNMYRWSSGAIEPVWPLDQDFGLPQWTLGTATYGFDGEDVVCVYGAAGGWRLALVPVRDGAPKTYDLAYGELANVRVIAGHAIVLAASTTASPALIDVTLANGNVAILRQPGQFPMSRASVSVPEPISFPTNGATAHAFYYPPHNPDFVAPAGERPPLIVFTHGGPTGSTSTALSPQIQFWTSRGFAVLDVNYRGSTGYGRNYRAALNGGWGVIDVEDCINGAKAMVHRGDVDGDRLLIRGGSAGGYTTLCVLTFHETFRAGASHYGIGDLEALAKHTHKFESRYLDRLVGRYPAQRDLYLARSPIQHVDRLNCPIIFFQGLEDRVVPPAQAEAMVAALRAKSIAVAYLPFAGEQHGFRRAENIQRALEAELYFYGQVLGFTPADEVAPISIENLPD